jgi:hypothetical protein
LFGNTICSNAFNTRGNNRGNRQISGLLMWDFRQEILGKCRKRNPTQQSHQLHRMQCLRHLLRLSTPEPYTPCTLLSDHIL